MSQLLKMHMVHIRKMTAIFYGPIPPEVFRDFVEYVTPAYNSVTPIPLQQSEKITTHKEWWDRIESYCAEFMELKGIEGDPKLARSQYVKWRFA